MRRYKGIDALINPKQYCRDKMPKKKQQPKGEEEVERAIKLAKPSSEMETFGVSKEVADILSPKHRIALQLQGELDGTLESYMVLMLIKPELYTTTSIELAKYFTQVLGLSGIYLTLNKPYEDLVEMLEDEGIDADKIYFIDCISKLTGRRTEGLGKNCIFVDSPQALAQITTALQKLLSIVKEGEQRFMVFDSISTLLVYYDKEPVGKFTHFMIGMIRKWKLRGVLLMVEEGDKRGATEMMSLFCDRVVKIDHTEL